jgi:hypothetical protein
MPTAFAVANSPLTSNGTLEVTGAGTTAQYIRGDGSLASFPSLTGYVPYTGATADVDLGTHDLTAERGTFQNNGSSDTLTVNHTSGSGYGIIVTKGGNNEALYVSKTSGSGNAMTVIGGRTSLVDLALSSVTNTAGDFLTLSGGVVHKRTAAQTLTDIGGQAALTNPVTGTGSAGQVAYWSSGSAITGESNLFWDATNDRLGIGNSFPTSRLDIGNGTLTLPTLRGRTYTLLNVASENPNFINGTGFNSIPVRVGDIIDLPFGQTRTVTAVTDTQLTVNTAWTVSFAGSNVEGRGAIFFETNNITRLIITGNGEATFSSNLTANSFIKSGGTSTQFLMADGSVDSTTYVPVGRTITINGTTQDLSANRTFNVGTVTSVTASSPLFSSGGATPNITIQQASGSQNGFLSSTDWTTFNNKADAGNYVTLDTTQTITAQKTFSLDIIVNGVNVGKGGGSVVNNTRIGNGSLLDNTTGSGNTAIGFSSLSLNTTGASNTSLGNFTLRNNTIGNSNTAVGSNSINANTIGNQNTAIGDSSLSLNTSGSQNTAVGRASLFTNTTANNNTSIGFFALYYNTTGGENTAIGSEALFENTTGSFNIAVGNDAGRLISAGGNNVITNNSVFIGSETRSNANNETNQIVIGYQAIGNGSNSVTLGNTSITKTILRGNVGIGTTPNQKLHIAGTTKVAPATPASNAVSTLILSNDFDNDNVIKHTSTKGLAFEVTGNERMRISPGGNVLIGTTTSGSSRLRIVGLPTSAVGLSSGDVYNLSGVLMIA